MKVIAFLTFCALLMGAASAQKLPPTSRTVYKCEDGGKVHYSDAPCLGGRKIDVEPTRGLDKSSGKSRTGNDVRHERNREMFAEAVKPLTGMDAKQLDAAGRRMKLSTKAQQDCRRLDGEIPIAEQEQAQAPQGVAGKAAQQRLFGLRTMYRSTGC
jgi:hypothetical protein